MIRSFKNKLAEHLFEGIPSKETRRFPQSLHATAIRKLTQLDVSSLLETLNRPPGNHLEALRGDRKGQHSIRINNQWRICFIWSTEGPKCVEIVDYH